MIACRFCTLDLHGRPHVRSWTRLARTVNGGARGYETFALENDGVESSLQCADELCSTAWMGSGDTIIVLQEPVDWPEGSKIVLAPSSFHKDECARASQASNQRATNPDPDPDSDPSPDPDLDPDSDPNPNPDPDSDPSPSPDPDPDPDPNPDPDPDPDSDPNPAAHEP